MCATWLPARSPPLTADARESCNPSNDEVSLKELCEMLKAETGCRGCLFYLPLSLAHFAAKQMEARAAKTGKPAVLTEFAVYNLERNNHFDCSKAKK